MTLDDFTTERIFEDVAKLQYLYGLKKVIRYDKNRTETDSTESVAEHVFGMHLLAQYFLPLEDPHGTWDKARLYEMMTIHDIGEIETGDVLSYLKTDAIRAQELAAIKTVIAQSPLHMQSTLHSLTEEYEAKVTIEAKFAKAMDKIEPLFQIFNEDGRHTMCTNKTTAEQSLRIKAPYIEPFPFVKKCALTIHQALIDGEYYYKGDD